MMTKISVMLNKERIRGRTIGTSPSSTGHLAYAPTQQEQHYNSIKKLIAKNKLKDAINELMDYIILNADKEAINNTIILSFSVHSLLDTQTKGILDWDEYHREAVKIVNRMLNLLDESIPD